MPNPLSLKQDIDLSQHSWSFTEFLSFKTAAIATLIGAGIWFKRTYDKINSLKSQKKAVQRKLDQAKETGTLQRIHADRAQSQAQIMRAMLEEIRKRGVENQSENIHINPTPQDSEEEFNSEDADMEAQRIDGLIHETNEILSTTRRKSL